MNLVPLRILHDPQRLLSMISQRQEALSDNIANMHTTGYKRKDVDFSQYLTGGASSHIEARVNEKYGAAPIANISDNTQDISIEEEFSLMQQNSLMYSVAVRNLSSTITEIKTALNMSAG